MDRSSAFLAKVARALSTDGVIDDLTLREAHAGDESGLAAVVPFAVLRPRNAADVSTVLTAANEFGVPVTVRGAGTGKAGGAIPDRQGVVLSLSQLSPVFELSQEDGAIEVDASCRTESVHRAAEAASLFYGPDPQSAGECTIGGNIATNAAGPRALKYGSTREWVLGLEAVTADGTIHQFGQRTTKSSTGYDLRSLLVGSEGTLAVVTRARLRLRPAAARVWTMLVFLRDERSVAQVAVALSKVGVSPRCLEFIGTETSMLMQGSGAFVAPDGAEAALILELDGNEASVERDAQVAAEVLLPYSVRDPDVAITEASRARLWNARHELSRALRRSAKYKLSEDVVVARSRLGELLDACQQIADANQVRMPAYGHAGDGNLHVNVLWDDESGAERAARAIEQLFRRVVALGGSLSGEHGIGLSKAPYLSIEHDVGRIELARAIKALFDPRGILNPGKIFAQKHHEC